LPNKNLVELGTGEGVTFMVPPLGDKDKSLRSKLDTGGLGVGRTVGAGEHFMHVSHAFLQSFLLIAAKVV